MEHYERIGKLAAEYAGYFKKDTRNDGSEFWKADPQPEPLADLIHNAHDAGGIFPDDYRYRFIYQALSDIEEAVKYEQDFDEVELEIDADTDIYTWLASHGYRPAYVDDAREIYGGETLAEMVSYGMIEEKREVFRQVLESLADQAEELYLSEDEED